MKKMLCVLIMCLSVFNIMPVYSTTAYVTAISVTCTNTFVGAVTSVESTESTTTEKITDKGTQTTEKTSDKFVNKSKTSPATGNNHYYVLAIVILILTAFYVFYYKKEGKKNNG